MGFTLGTKFNDNTDWEFTVSNETLQQVVAGGGIAEEDIADYCYTAFIDSRIYSLTAEGGRNTIDGLYPWAVEYCPVYNTNSGSHPSKCIMNTSLLESTAVTCYERNILTYYGTINGITGHFLVMDIKDIKKWVQDYDDAGCFSSASVTSTAGYNGIDGTIYIYDTNNVPTVNPLNAPAGTTGGLHTINICIIADDIWVGAFTPSAHSKNLICNEHLTHQAWDFAYSAGDTFNANYPAYVLQAGSNALQGWNYFSDIEFPDPSGVTTLFTAYYCFDDVNVIKISGQYGNNANPYITNCEMGNYFKNLDAQHLIECWCGLLFVDNGVVYKPIIQQGVITGYTSDMSETSEFDDMSNVTGNNISPTPPAPPSGDDEDNDDPISTIGAPFATGLARYYATTAASVLLSHISDAMGTWDVKNTQIDLYKNLISCKLVKPPSAIPTSGSEPFTIHGQKLQYEGADIELPVISDNPTATFGSYSIPRKFNDFRDYAPYTRCEIFLPYCGWCALPSHVVGRTVSVKYFTDIIAATCKAVVFCGNNIVAEAAGCIGLDIPFAAENVGAKMAAANAALLATTSGGLEAAMGVGSVVASKSPKGIGSIIKGMSGYASGFSQANATLNANYTEISGRTGDGCNLSGATNIIIKITRPKKGGHSDPPYVPSGYGKSSGFISLKNVTVGSVTGFLQADNVDTSGIAGATERERQLIKAYLESGIIVNHPEE